MREVIGAAWGRFASLLVVSLLLAGVSAAQSRTFWVFDDRVSQLSHGAPGVPSSPGIGLPGNPRRVRATPGGPGVVADAGGGFVHVMSATAVTSVQIPGSVTAAAPDETCGAWVTSRFGPTSDVYHVDPGGIVTLRATVAGIATAILPIRGGLLLLVSRVQSVSWLSLLDASGTNVLDAVVLPQHPFDLVLLNDGRVVVPGAAAGSLPVVDTQSQTIDVVGFVPVVAPVLAVAPISANDQIMVIDGSPSTVRLIDVTGTPSWSVVVPAASALESLPEGDVLVHQGGLARAWMLDRFGFASWAGPWPASHAAPDGAGMQFARATPDADPDGDGFSNAREIAHGSDPGDPRSAPLAAWREGATLRLAARDARVGAYLVVASDGTVAGSDPILCSPGPLLYSSLVAGVCFDAPFGALAAGQADVTLLPGLPVDPWMAVAGFGPGLLLLHSLDARRRSAW